jgi:hypothetical protein
MERIFSLAIFLTISLCSCGISPTEQLINNLKPVVIEYSKSDKLNSKRQDYYAFVFDNNEIWKGNRVYRIQGYKYFLEIAPQKLSSLKKINGINSFFLVEENKFEEKIVESLIKQSNLGNIQDPIEWTIMVNSSNEVEKVLKNTGYMPLDSLVKYFKL